METMVTTLVLEEIVARQRCKGCMIITEGGADGSHSAKNANKTTNEPRRLGKVD